ncbi:HAD family phosphatase [Sphingomonas sp. SUN039]|uniref:HAD family hydrolase n=1 Tax=Sphingomonas sp. SUN039 TaxID=2937787 RepID=UPI00216418F6|nr:HAD family phosphatase [Sphingomonas sp. SUN039]UVO55252.1 HAD family phosphatase [Sphingomonas sp. SUN039]
MNIDGIIFDFDGVLIESEYAGNLQIARTLTGLGYPTTVDQALAKFVGLGGRDFLDAVAGHIGGPVPDAFHAERQAEDARVLAQGIDAVEGAIAFVRSLSGDLPRAIASSSTSHWIETHLAHIGLRDAFGPHIYSGREHVTRGKPAPDIYLHAAAQIGTDIARTLIIEDSPVGVTGAVASGAQVVGLAVGQHCGPDHEAILRRAGAPVVVHDFAAIARMVAGRLAA